MDNKKIKNKVIELFNDYFESIENNYEINPENFEYIKNRTIEEIEEITNE